jgi:hypothetical protein
MTARESSSKPMIRSDRNRSPPHYVQDGVMLPGATAHTGSGDILVSPAKARVIRYLKGTGPSLVTIDTGISKNVNGVSGNEDGIEPKVGQRWRIYSGAQSMPYQTSICMGSVPVSDTQP